MCKSHALSSRKTLLFSIFLLLPLMVNVCHLNSLPRAIRYTFPIFIFAHRRFFSVHLISVFTFASCNASLFSLLSLDNLLAALFSMSCHSFCNGKSKYIVLWMGGWVPLYVCVCLAPQINRNLSICNANCNFYNVYSVFNANPMLTTSTDGYSTILSQSTTI